MFWGLEQSLRLADVRALLELLAEVRALGATPAAWRAHLASELSRLCDARAVVSSELLPRRAVSPAQQQAVTSGSCQAAVQTSVVAYSGVGEGEAAGFFEDVIWYDHARDHTLSSLLPLYGTTFVRSRSDLANDRSWYRSPLANERFRKHDCDDFILAMCAVPGVGAICSLELFRPWGSARFTEREQALVQLVQHELSRDFRRARRTRRGCLAVNGRCSSCCGAAWAKSKWRPSSMSRPTPCTTTSRRFTERTGSPAAASCWPRSRNRRAPLRGSWRVKQARCERRTERFASGG